MRKVLSAVVLSAAVLIGAMGSESAIARGGYRHHHRAHVGVFIGAPLLFAPWYYHPAPVYYPAPVVAYPPAPAVYVEQGQEAAPPAPRADSYWYYCPEAKAYYPYVSQCAGGWQRVSPRPPS
jgi:hypothetical protein